MYVHLLRRVYYRDKKRSRISLSVVCVPCPLVLEACPGNFFRGWLMKVDFRPLKNLRPLSYCFFFSLLRPVQISRRGSNTRNPLPFPSTPSRLVCTLTWYDYNYCYYWYYLWLWCYSCSDRLYDVTRVRITTGFFHLMIFARENCDVFAPLK